MSYAKLPLVLAKAVLIWGLGLQTVFAQAPTPDSVAVPVARAKHGLRWYPTRVFNLNFYAITFGYERSLGERWSVELAGGPVTRDGDYPSAPLVTGFNAASSARYYLADDAFYVGAELDLAGARYEETGFRQNASLPYSRYEPHTVRTRRQEVLFAVGWRPLARGDGGGTLDFDIRLSAGVGRSGRFSDGGSGDRNEGATDDVGLIQVGRRDNSWYHYAVPRLRVGVGYKW